MNYWILTTEYPPLFGGGISTYCYHTARMLAQGGVRVTVFFPDMKESGYSISMEEAVRIIRFNPHRSGVDSFLGFAPRLSYEFAQIVRDIVLAEGKPDIIEAQDYLAVPYYLLQFKALKYPEFEGIPVLLTLHSPAFLYLHYNREETFHYPNYWTGEMEWSCIASADHIIAPSAFIVEAIKAFGTVPEERLSVVRNPYAATAVPEAAPAPARHTSGDIVFYGKLSPQKGIFELLQYMCALWDQGFPHALTLIGGTDKVYYPEMKTMGQVVGDRYAGYVQKGLLRIVGKIPPSERDARLSSAHIILIPSIIDNLPYAAIEAMSIGKAVLASVQGGQAEIIRDGQEDPGEGTGFLFDHTIPGSFGEKLRYIFSLSGEALDQVGQRAASSMRRELAYSKVYEQKMEVVRTLLAAGGSREVFPFIREVPPSAAGEALTGTGSAGATGFAARPPAEVVRAAGPVIPGLLSVVVPYYNMGAYIGDCIDSLLKSTFHPMEILVVNDGSTDPASVEALKDVAAHPHVRVLHRRNAGLALTRNYGAAHARGEYLAFLDADDCVQPEYYHKAIRVLAAYRNVSFVGCWAGYFGGSGRTWPAWNPEPPYILLHNTLNSSALVYKRTAFLEAGLNDKALEYGLEDYESVISLLGAGHRGVALPETLFRYRVRKGSMFRALTVHKILYSQQYIAAKHSALYSRYAVELFNLLNANGPSYAYDNPTMEVKVSSKIVGGRGIKNRIKEMAKRNPALKGVLLRFKNVLKLK